MLNNYWRQNSTEPSKREGYSISSSLRLRKEYCYIFWIQRIETCISWGAAKWNTRFHWVEFIWLLINWNITIFNLWTKWITNIILRFGKTMFCQYIPHNTINSKSVKNARIYLSLPKLISHYLSFIFQIGRGQYWPPQVPIVHCTVKQATEQAAWEISMKAQRILQLYF